MPRFDFLDPLALTGALEQTLREPAQRRSMEADQAEPIAVDVYREADTIVIEGALPGARLLHVAVTRRSAGVQTDSISSRRVRKWVRIRKGSRGSLPAARSRAEATSRGCTP